MKLSILFVLSIPWPYIHSVTVLNSRFNGKYPVDARCRVMIYEAKPIPLDHGVHLGIKQITRFPTCRLPNCSNHYPPEHIGLGWSAQYGNYTKSIGVLQRDEAGSV